MYLKVLTFPTGEDTKTGEAPIYVENYMESSHILIRHYNESVEIMVDGVTEFQFNIEIQDGDKVPKDIEGFSIYLMNDKGKTIDSYNLFRKEPVEINN